MVLSVTPELLQLQNSLYNPYLGVLETALGGFQHFNHSIAPTVELWIILLTLRMIFHILHALPYAMLKRRGGKEAWNGTLDFRAVEHHRSGLVA